jgi:outer membrane beta-barrel protein
MTMRKITRALIVLVLVLLPQLALGAAKNLLEGQPAIRHRFELRKARFEFGPSFSMAMNRFLRHSVLLGAKLEYHITDWLSVGTDCGYGIGFDTSVKDEIAGQYGGPEQIPRWQQLTRRMSDIQFAGDVRVSFTPFAGKLSLFSYFFIAYDMYFFGGFAFAYTKNNGDGQPASYGRVIDGDDNSPYAEVDAANKGFRPGAAFGFGVHLFFNHWFSLGLELKDLLFSDNESGGDVTRGLTGKENGTVMINGDDRTFMNHMYGGINFTFYLPYKPDVSP